MPGLPHCACGATLSSEKFTRCTACAAKVRKPRSKPSGERKRCACGLAVTRTYTRCRWCAARDRAPSKPSARVVKWIPGRLGMEKRMRLIHGHEWGTV